MKASRGRVGTRVRRARVPCYGDSRATALALLAALLNRAVPDLLDHRGIGERRRVAKRPALRHVAQQPAHDLAAARLRELRREDDVRRLRDRPDLPGDVVAELLELLDR